jgi:uncharacterized protein (DUF305 family)
LGPSTGWTLIALILALCLLAGAAGWTLGKGRPPARGSADVGFLHDMRSHHEGAIRISQIQLANGTQDSIKVFAEEIILFQSYEIGRMDQLLLDWRYRPENRPGTAMGWMGHDVAPDVMPGMATEAEIDLLQTPEAPTDAMFVALMVDHHAGGVAMATAAAERAADPEVRELAERMTRIQRAEIDEMLAAAGRAGLDLEPDGVVFDAYDPETGTFRVQAPPHGSHNQRLPDDGCSQRTSVGGPEALAATRSRCPTQS